MLDKAAIRGLIPHAGAMCLPDAVTGWDADGLTATADNHRHRDHPLRDGDRLDAVCAIEYAAQAMALHGALTAGQAAAVGFLAAVRAVTLHRERLDHLPAPLEIEVRRLAGDIAGFVYEFNVRSGGEPVAEGRATVMHRGP